MKLETLVQKNYKKLNENDLYLWNYILHHKKECKTMSIQELSLKCNVSHTTVLRFAKKLGFEGYSEMKTYLKWEDKGTNKFDDEEVERVFKDIENTVEIMKKKDFSEVFEMLEGARRIYAYGSGSVQKQAVKDLKRNMIFGSKLIYVLDGMAETDIIMDMLSSKDLFFLFSLSGNNAFMNNFARKLKKKGVKIISVTKVGNNELAYLSDVALQFYSHSVFINESQSEYYSTAQFYLINQIMLTKYLAFKWKKNNT
ncbi:MurR/RpiR family transcriptional regulator [Clostridium sp. cel8]|jgi:RpiR family transcriptional regulator, glv operon transcriptional regulator|uniref:MurR/RpiR family transcriptional regulator n=1 Tax=unclassified Clostridium TaxID=2614128 RepID=UPI0015F7119D|nr:MurR/RpiR family transcriptional regulator [Clostridium sp. cel8]MBA5850083.1 MurR/RpiR family transcriptional regulator [Clostridium sp. cel8]